MRHEARRQKCTAGSLDASCVALPWLNDLQEILIARGSPQPTAQEDLLPDRSTLTVRAGGAE